MNEPHFSPDALRLVRARIGDITISGMAAGEVLEVESFDLGTPIAADLPL